jgi:hypothetical protein
MRMLHKFKTRLWARPDGLAWKLTEGFTLRSRRKKYGLFLRLVQPSHKERITALGVGTEDDYRDFKKAFPEVRLVIGDGRRLDFKDNFFDVSFSNAVVEHVGQLEHQRNFVHELVRVSKIAYVSTPNYWFPVDAHTLIPFAHYLPPSLRYAVYRTLGKTYWASINHLNLLASRQFLALFPNGIQVQQVRLRVLGLTHSLIAIARKRDD